MGMSGSLHRALMVKIILVKLLDEYKFKFVSGKRPPNPLLHEFVFFHPKY